MNERVEVEKPKSNTNDNKKLKLFLIFLVFIIIGVTIFMLVKKQNDIEEATSNPSLPNQAEVSK